jgi:hypothetical protein
VVEAALVGMFGEEFAMTEICFAVVERGADL